MKQTPPVPQMEYSKSKGADSVMSMIEKLIYDTKEITAESKKSESEAQAAYEALVADTNDSIRDLGKEITSKTKARAQAKKKSKPCSRQSRFSTEQASVDRAEIV